MKAKCFDLKKELLNYVNDNILNILLSFSIAMIFVIANSQVLINAALYGSWFLAFFSLFICGFTLSYILISFIFKLIKK
ncbi:hypothetical protein [Companilactobacillus ginsenosidimutans]|uniref:Uncharacterized protein n=1 Tax=Companilactobacillus ginsenosidimutans TaxID=1007676 RepID=A0A0H4QD80_9LACO|nr:hypothetical protein [Companilactobacillus ginsenosidimutans]AKP66294.1 hypothetical protein ABM34_01160 [Companilactobacillus ginsenosidimutans]